MAGSTALLLPARPVQELAEQAPGGGAETGPLPIGAVPRGSLGTSRWLVSGRAGAEDSHVLLVQRHVSQGGKAGLRAESQARRPAGVSKGS